MTLDAAVNKAAAAFDAAMAQHLDAQELRLIESGASLEDSAAFVQHQRAVYAEWRSATLAAVRAWLLAEFA